MAQDGDSNQDGGNPWMLAIKLGGVDKCPVGAAMLVYIVMLCLRCNAI